MPRIVPFKQKSTKSATTVALDLDAAWGLYDKQAAFVKNNSLFSLFLGGVGSGKTHAMTAWVIRRALVNPGSVGAMMTRTIPEMQKTQLPALFERFDEIQRQCGVNLIMRQDKGIGSLTLYNGSTILLVPYNRIAKVRSLTITYAALDEVEFSEADPDEIWSVINGRLRGKGPFPGLAFTTSPNGLRGITKKFVEAQRKYADARQNMDLAGMATWGQFYCTTATSFSNPFLPDHYFDALRSMSKRRYKQEVEGKVLRPTNTILQIEAQHFVDWNWRDHPQLPRVYGVDWGTNAHHVAIMFQVRPDGTWVACEELTLDDMPRGHFEAKLYEFVDKHSAACGKSPPAMFGVDRACPAENQKLSLRYRHSYVAWMESKEDQKVVAGLEMLRNAMDPQLGDPQILFSTALAQTFGGDTASIVPALRNYVYHLDAEGQPTLRPKKDNIHDHAPDALRYAWHGSADRRDLHGGNTLWQSALTATKPDAAKTVGNSGDKMRA